MRCPRCVWGWDERAAEFPRTAVYVAYALWTLRHIREVIRKRFGVRYSPVGVWAPLRHGLGWSWQKPERRALQHDEDEAVIAQSKRNAWPRLKKHCASGRASRVSR